MKAGAVRKEKKTLVPCLRCRREQKATVVLSARTDKDSERGDRDRRDGVLRFKFQVEVANVSGGSDLGRGVVGVVRSARGV